MRVNAVWPWLMVVSAGIGLRVGIASVSPLLDRIQTELGVSTAALGLFTAIPLICMRGQSFMGSAVERRWGLMRSMRIALGVLGIGLLWRGWAHGFAVLAMTAVLVGVGDALIRPLLSGFIKQTFGNGSHAVMGLYAASMGIGAALSAYTTPHLAAALGSWQWGLGCWAVPVLLALLIWTRRPVPTNSPPPRTTAAPRLAAMGVVWLTLFFGLQAGVNYTVVAWLPSVCLAQGTTASTAAYVMALFLCVQTLSSLLFPLVLDRTSQRLTLLSLCFAGVTAAGVMVLVMPSGGWLAAVLLGIGTGGLFPIALSLPLIFSKSGHETTRLSSLSQSGGYALGGLLPWLTGVTVPMLGATVAVVVLCVTMLIVLMIVIGKVTVYQRALRRA